MIAWPKPARLLARPDGGQIAWWAEGEGEQTLLWVHGLPLDSRSWGLQRAHFGAQVRSVFVDLRGYGRSSKLPDDVSSVTSLYTADLLALIDAIGGQPPIVIGFASAGHVVLRLAAEQGAKLSGAVIINGSPRFMRGRDWAFGFDAAGLKHFSEPLHDGNLELALDRILDPAVVFRDVSKTDAISLAASFREMGRLAGARTLLGFFDDIAKDDDLALLDRIDTPTLFISSALGSEVPTDVGLYLRQRVRRAFLAELAGADHFAFITRPVLVNAVIDDFLSVIV